MISVIVATRNRASLLEMCLQSIFNNTYAGDYEVIVINDCSADTTPLVLARFQEQFPGTLSVISNTEVRGISYNKNCGVRKAKGDIVAFTDDDCEVADTWLTIIHRAFDDPHIAGIYGVAVKHKRVVLPWYWQPSMNWAIGLSVPQNYLIGSNMAFRKYVLENNEFSRYFGSGKEGMHYGDDLEFSLRLFKQNVRLVFLREMIVWHTLDKKRLTVCTLIERSFQEGEVLGKLNQPGELVKRIAAIIAFPFRLLFMLDGNALLRMFVSLGYFRWRFRKNKKI